MQKTFTSTATTPDTLPSSDEINKFRQNTLICFQLLLTSWIVPNICGKENTLNNNLDFQFGMYEPATYSIIVNAGNCSILIIRCKECNFSITFNTPNAIVYFYRLAEESPLLYAKQTLKGNELQNYVDAMN